MTSQEGQGTSFAIKLPMTLAVIEALVVQVGKERYVLPASAVDRSIKIPANGIKKSAEQEVFVLDQNEVQLLRLDQKFSRTPPPTEPRDELAVIIQVDGQRVGLIVDDIVETSQVIIKPVPDILKDNRAFAGVTILGDGQSVLLINPKGVVLSG